MHYPWILQANRIFTGVLVSQFLLSFVIAFFTNTYTEAMIGSFLFTSLPLVLIRTAPDSFYTRIAVGIAVQLMAALHIQQASGLIEIHFEIFVVLAFLSVYRDWRVILASVLVVAVHHVLFFFIQSQGGGVYIFEEGHISFGILVIHALFALTEGAVLMYITYLIHHEAIAAHSLSDSIHKILRNKEEFDLTVDISRDNKSLVEFSLLIDSVKQLIGRARNTSEEVFRTARDLQKLTQDIYSGASFNTSQVTDIATAIEQMSVTNEDVARRAEEANTLSKKCSENTHASKDRFHQSRDDISALDTHLNEASATINELAKMCKKIDDAMSSIKSVADQTNLLALNAAIESARAGEHGRGFTVVADEVRQLANRTSSYTDDISQITSTLITEANNSVEKINNCIKSANNTKTSSDLAITHMNDVNAYNTQLASNIDLVATAVEEQSAVSNDIARSAQQLHESTNGQRDKIQLSTGSIEKLINNLDSLHTELSKFRV